MKPASFDEANCRLKAPPSLTEQQVLTIHAYAGQAQGGSMDGVPIAVTAWQPTAEELQALNDGGVLYLTFVGRSLPPHYPSTNFHGATHPA